MLLFFEVCFDDKDSVNLVQNKKNNGERHPQL